MTLSTDEIKVIIRLKLLGRQFRIHDARKAGAKHSNFCKYMGDKGILVRVPRTHFWELSDKAKEEINELKKLLEQVQ